MGSHFDFDKVINVSTNQTAASKGRTIIPRAKAIPPSSLSELVSSSKSSLSSAVTSSSLSSAVSSSSLGITDNASTYDNYSPTSIWTSPLVVQSKNKREEDKQE